MRNRIHFIALLATAFLAMMTLSACSNGGGGGSHPTVNDIVVLPGSSSVPVSQTAQFTAFLNGASTTVTWTASGGTITGTGAFTAPTAAGTVTITATSGSDTGTATVSVVAAQTLVVNPAALTIPAGGLQAFTATPSTGVTWTVNGVAFGDCIAPAVGSVAQCHGVIDGNGNYTAPLSPPTGGTVTIGAAAGGNSGTATAQVLYSSASLTTTTLGTGQYAIAFDGVDFTVGNPVDVAGSIVTSGSASSSTGMITGGEMDLNTGVGGTAFVVPVSGGSFQVGPLDGRTSMLLTLASNSVAASFTLQATLATNQHALLIDFDTSDTGSGTLDAQNPTAFATPLNGNFAFQYSGVDSNLNPVTTAGIFLASNNSIPVNNPNSPVNAQDFTYVPINTDTLTVVSNDITLSGLYTNPDTFGRGTVTMNSTDLGTINFSYYMIDQTHLKLVEIDPAPQPYILFGEAFSSPTATTPLSGGVVCTFGGAANDAPYAGGAVFAISGATIGSGGTLDINNSGGDGTQINSAITSGSYANVLTEGNVPARYTLSLTTSKGTAMFAAYTFVTASTTGAELVEIDTNNGIDGANGTAYQRGGVSTVQGSFALNLSGVGSSKSQPAFEQDITGQLGLVNNSTTLTGTLDINNLGPIPGVPVNSTSILNPVAANGRGTAQVNVSGNGVSAKFNLVYYQVDSNTELLLDADTNRVASGMLIRQF
jgi:trimeric autotransporter adhesin